MTSGRFHTWQSDPGPKPRSRHARQIKDPATAEKAEGGVKYANPRDKYILILLEYKLTPQPSGCSGGLQREGVAHFRRDRGRPPGFCSFGGGSASTRRTPSLGCVTPTSSSRRRWGPGNPGGPPGGVSDPDAIRLSSAPLSPSAEHPLAEKGTRLLGRRRRRKTRKLIKRFSEAICSPLGLGVTTSPAPRHQPPHCNFYRVSSHHD